MSDHSVKYFSRARLSADDVRLIAEARKAIDRSQQRLRDTRPLTDPHRLSPHLTRNFVSIAETGHEWRVIVEEAGIGTVIRSFRHRLPAFNFAQCQVMRLGLDKISSVHGVSDASCISVGPEGNVRPVPRRSSS
ncbi:MULTISPECIES: hypothetical protein [unclassified Mesorhizobium]|uniref:hypothetical protein n=1 Tax=unclassified Mesorhizobium TaxID=325217 RepID=UPI00241537CB|nr:MULTISPECIES: hypothetical protein [unclassified Mesorhizobium]MDG4853748.1 hypothetical protein [Mesorhizobium sp. WSM4982]MDG4915594.1 hypothetical protein [Mesorhizobium sp. WSM4983]